MGAVFVYMTAADIGEAELIGRVLVEKRLAACVNILDGMRSLYWWDGKVQSDAECVFIAKTMDTELDVLTREVKALHSYDVPCVAALPITGGNPDFLQWIENETRKRS